MNYPCAADSVSQSISIPNAIPISILPIQIFGKSYILESKHPVIITDTLGVIYWEGVGDISDLAKECQPWSSYSELFLRMWYYYALEFDINLSENERFIKAKLKETFLQK